MGQNANYLRNGFHGSCYGNGSLTTRHCCGVDMEGVMKLWEDPRAWFLPYM